MTLNKTIQTFSLNVKSHSTNTTATIYELNRSLEAGFKKKKSTKSVRVGAENISFTHKDVREGVMVWKWTPFMCQDQRSEAFSSRSASASL